MIRIIFYFFLLIVTSIITYSFIFNKILNRDYLIFYPQTKTLNKEEINLCYETLKVNQYYLNKNDIVFNLFESLVTGPKNIFLDQLIEKPLSINNVLIFDDLLLVDFNRYILDLSHDEEQFLLLAFSTTIRKNFPEIKQMIWLVESKNFITITSKQQYSFPIYLNGILTNKFPIQLSQTPSCNHVS